MSIRTFHDIEVENGRPVPADRPDDYSDSGIWGCIYSRPSLTGKDSFRVFRKGDNHPTEEYRFETRVEADGDDPSVPTKVIATPVSRTTARLREHASGYKVRMKRGGRKPKTREESIGLDELPDVIRRYVEDYECIRLVESVYPEPEAEQ